MEDKEGQPVSTLDQVFETFGPILLFNVEIKEEGWADKKGYRIHVWTVVDPTEAIRLVNLGVHGIISNKPRLIGETLSAQ